MNGFIFEFKEKCETNFISNFKLIEKNAQDELQIFDYSQLHYRNLERLLLQGRATLQRELLNYSFKYLNIIKEIEMMKIESITRYFIENFERLKEERNKEFGKINAENEREENPETYWEYENKTGMIRLGFWANNLVQSTFRTVATKFTGIPIFVREFHKNFVVNNSIIRFFWCGYDIREYLSGEKLEIESAYTPYMSIGGTFFLEELKYPAKMVEKGTWLIREMIGEQYKHGEGKDGQFTKNVKMRYKISLPKNIFIEDLKNVDVGLYDQDTGQWKLETQDIVFKQEEKEKDKIKYIDNVVEFTTTELGIFGILIKREINFPYKAWNLRCIKNDNKNLIAILDLITPRTKFVFELGLQDEKSYDSESIEKNRPYKAYMKLIDNEEKVFEHITNKYMTFDQMILALKDCGILIAPWKEDIEAIGIREKNYDTVKRAVDDITMACRYYSIRSHEFNKLIETDLIAVKAKPNPEFDKYFFDDEQKDWTDFCWYPNKASIGKFVVEKDNKIVFQKSIETTRPRLHLIIKDTQPKEVYEQIVEDDFSSAFLVNIRNVIRVLNLVNIP